MIKIIFLLSLIALACSTRLETFNFGFQNQVCIDNLNLNLPEECINYEQNCKDCYDENYLKECVFTCEKDTILDFNSKCTDYCYQMRKVCNNCLNTWRKCTCPQGTTSIKKDDGSSSCQLLRCPDGYWRAPDNNCVDCYSCDIKCKTCQDNALKCFSCLDGFCLVEQNKCVDPKEYVCPNGLYKHYSIEGCPICENKCPVGQYPNAAKECTDCPKECTSCSSASSCNTCDSEYCLFENQCVLPSFQCPNSLFKRQNTQNKCFECVPCNGCLLTQFCDNKLHECSTTCDYPPSFIYQQQCIQTCPSMTQTSTIFTFGATNSDIGRNFGRNWNGLITAKDDLQVASCSSQPYIGPFGLGDELQKQFNSLPPHQQVKISFLIFAIDTWDWDNFWGKDEFQFYADDRKVFSYKKTGSSSIPIQCQLPLFTDEVNPISFIIDHSSSNLRLVMKSTLNEIVGDESWGFNNLKVELITNKETYLIFKQPKEVNQCVFCESCPQNTYCNKETLKCDECIGEDKFIWNYQCVSECSNAQFRHLDTCVDNCPSGYFGNDTTKKCDLCSDNCLTCIGSPTTCQFPCPKNLIFFNNKCVPSCDSNQFLSKMTTDLTGYLCYPQEQEDCQCRKCHETCETCLGPNTNDCITCQDSLFLKNGQCRQECPAGDYADQAEKSCNCCHQGCATCWGPRIDECWSCDANHFRIGSTCYLNQNKVGSAIQNILNKQATAKQL